MIILPFKLIYSSRCSIITIIPFLDCYLVKKSLNLIFHSQQSTRINAFTFDSLLPAIFKDLALVVFIDLLNYWHYLTLLLMFILKIEIVAPALRFFCRKIKAYLSSERYVLLRWRNSQLKWLIFNEGIFLWPLNFLSEPIEHLCFSIFQLQYQEEFWFTIPSHIFGFPTRW